MRYNENLSALKTVTENVTSFKGLNFSENAAPSELYRAENIALDTPYVITERSARSTIRQGVGINSIFAGDVLCRVEGTKFYYGDEVVGGITLTEGEKQICSIENYILIFPDGIYVNISNLSDSGNICSTYSSASGIYCDTVDETFNVMDDYLIEDVLPEDPAVGQFCAIPNSKGKYEMKQFTGQYWKDVKTYIRLWLNGVGTYFQLGDIVEVQKWQDKLGNGFKIDHIAGSALFYEGVIKKTTVSGLVVSRVLPTLDYVTVSGGRVWGCRRGVDNDGNMVNRVYASAKGDPLSWTEKVEGCGLMLDVNADGEFCGMCDFAGNPVAFKRNAIIEINHNNVRGVYAKVNNCNSVERGAYKSIVQLNGKIYYKTPKGIYEYDGNKARCISDNIGVLENSDGFAPAVAYNGKYYVSVSPENGTRAIFCYDPLTNIWYSEEDPGVVELVVREGLMYALVSDENGQKIMLLDEKSATKTEKEHCAGVGYPKDEEVISWSFETGKIGNGDFKALYPVRLCMRIGKNERGFSAGLIFDGNTKADVMTDVPAGVTGSIVIPISHRRAESVRVNLRGTGGFEMLGYALEYTVDGDIRGWN